MQSKTVGELMVRITKDTKISREANLFEAIRALEGEIAACGDAASCLQALIVVDEYNHVLGKVSQFDIIRALEPNYTRIGSEIDHQLHRFGYSLEMLKSMYQTFNLWEKSTSELCKLAMKIRVEEIMYKPGEGEFINEPDDLFTAMHQIVMGSHRSLLVMRGREIVGILRSSDVFHELCRMIESCKL